MKKVFGAFLLTLTVYALVKANKREQPPLEVVPSVDLSRYSGKWYEIARLPNSFQKDCAGEVTATYTLRPDKKVQVVNECRKASGEMKKAEGLARLAEKDGPNTKLEVRFAPSFLSPLPFVWGDYWIIDLAPDYSYAVVGEPERKYLWILSRKPQMDEKLYQELVDRIKAKGFDVNRLIKTRQAASSS